MRSRTLLPSGACDCHVHLIGPAADYPFDPARVYTPGDASEAEVDALHERLGIDRVVIVHPSIYGADNRRTLDGLKRLGARARAVAVIDDATSGHDLDVMHAAGVRGVRVNIATQGMNDPEAAWRLLSSNAARVHRLGWHVQVLTKLDVIAALASHIPDLPVPLVIDHFGLLRPEAGLSQPGFEVLLALVRSGNALVKLSAIERLTGAGRGMRMAPYVRALVEANPACVVWGSDWPHTGGGRSTDRPISEIEPFEQLDDAAAIAVIRAAIADDSQFAAIFTGNPARLYDFPEEQSP